jgi:hypothetical protein
VVGFGRSSSRSVSRSVCQRFLEPESRLIREFSRWSDSVEAVEGLAEASVEGLAEASVEGLVEASVEGLSGAAVEGR